MSSTPTSPSSTLTLTPSAGTVQLCGDEDGVKGGGEERRREGEGENGQWIMQVVLTCEGVKW